MGNLLSFSPPAAAPDSLVSEAESLRKNANECITQAKAIAAQATAEFKDGSKATAKDLSNRKKQLYDQANHYNRQASNLYFTHYNKDRPMSEIDLHGLLVTEAITKVEKRINDLKSHREITQLIVITGRGNRSRDGLAKIKPEIQSMVIAKGEGEIIS